jgi:hypothetical protein
MAIVGYLPYVYFGYYIVGVTNLNTMEFVHMNVHPWFVINLYLIPILIWVHN